MMAYQGQPTYGEDTTMSNPHTKTIHDAMTAALRAVQGIDTSRLADDDAALVEEAANALGRGCLRQPNGGVCQDSAWDALRQASRMLEEAGILEPEEVYLATETILEATERMEW